MKQILLLVLVTLPLYSQEKGKLNQYIESIAQENVLKGSAVGQAGIMPRQYKRYLKLKELATEKELKQLLKHENLVVRIYALRAIVQRNIKINGYNLVVANLNNYKKVQTLNGCMGYAEYYGDLILATLSSLMLFAAKALETFSWL